MLKKLMVIIHKTGLTCSLESHSCFHFLGIYLADVLRASAFHSLNWKHGSCSNSGLLTQIGGSLEAMGRPIHACFFN